MTTCWVGRRAVLISPVVLFQFLGCVEYVRCKLLSSMCAVSVRQSVCLSRGSTRLHCAKTAEQIRILFGVSTLGSPRNIVLDGDPHPPRLAWGKLDAAFTKLLWPLVTEFMLNLFSPLELDRMGGFMAGGIVVIDLYPYSDIIRIHRVHSTRLFSTLRVKAVALICSELLCCFSTTSARTRRKKRRPLQRRASSIGVLNDMQVTLFESISGGSSVYYSPEFYRILHKAE